LPNLIIKLDGIQPLPDRQRLATSDERFIGSAQRDENIGNIVEQSRDQTLEPAVVRIGCCDLLTDGKSFAACNEGFIVAAARELNLCNPDIGFHRLQGGGHIPSVSISHWLFLKKRPLGDIAAQGSGARQYALMMKTRRDCQPSLSPRTRNTSLARRARSRLLAAKRWFSDLTKIGRGAR
jgi:hypothetical protein